LRNKAGKVVEILFSGYKLLTESALTAEMRALPARRIRAREACVGEERAARGELSDPAAALCRKEPLSILAARSGMN